MKHDASLTEEEIMRIAEWVEGGAPEGDPRYLPPVPPPAVSQAGQRVPARRLQTDANQRADNAARHQAPQSMRSQRSCERAPDGREEPLLWLYGYKRSGIERSWLAEAMRLPAGTKLIAEPAVPFELLVKSPRQVR